MCVCVFKGWDLHVPCMFMHVLDMYVLPCAHLSTCFLCIYLRLLISKCLHMFLWDYATESYLN